MPWRQLRKPEQLVGGGGGGGIARLAGGRLRLIILIISAIIIADFFISDYFYPDKSSISTPINLRIRTENIINIKPASAAIIISRPALTFWGLPVEVKTRMAPMTIRIKAIPPARPVAMVKT